MSTPPSNIPASTPRSGPHQSTLAGHPAIAPILPQFLARLAGYVQQLRAFLADQDSEGLKFLVHQLKGAGKSYGFAPISEQSAAIHQMLTDGRAMPQVQPHVQALIDYLENVEGYTPRHDITR